jgi:hypothetical protein
MPTPVKKTNFYPLISVTLLLLFGAALRLQHLVDFVEWPDEILTLWRTQGSIQDLLLRMPGDWPPLYSLLTWGWVQIAGPSLEASRFLMVLFAVLGMALVYRAVWEFLGGASVGALNLTPLRNPNFTGAFASTLTFAVMGYLIFAGVDVRAYGMLLMLGALALWLALRWLKKLSIGLMIALIVTLAALFYTSFTSILFIGFILLLMFILKPQVMTLPALGLIAAGTVVLSLPIIPQFIENGPGRVGDVMAQTPPPFFEALAKVYTDFGGSIWFLILLGAATLIIIVPVGVRRLTKGNAKPSPLHPETRKSLLLLLWVLFPVVVYIALYNNEFLKPRYMWWVALGLTLLIGYAVARLPRPAAWGALAFLVILPAFPVDFYNYRLAPTTSPPFRQSLRWLSQNMRSGDVLVIDPECTCGEPWGWDYFVPQFFPTGYLPIVTDPGDAARVWYLYNDGWEHDEDLLAEIADGRKPAQFYGPWFFLLRLYEGAPLREGVSFGGKVALHGVEIQNDDTIFGRGESFRVKLWWSAETALDADYSISVAMLDSEGAVIAQADGPAQAPETPEQTRAWQPNFTYEDYRTLQLPPDVADGNYRLVVTVYQWWDGVRLKPQENAVWRIFGEDYLQLERLRVIAY